MSKYYDYNYDYNYNDTGLQSYGGSPVIAGLKGFAGAVIGALPGLLLWIFLGKIGYIASAAGALIALGIVVGYGAFTKYDDLSLTVTLLICGAVFVVALIIGAKLVWTWKMLDAIKEVMPSYRDDVINAALEADPDLSRADLMSIFTDEMAEEYYCKMLGIKSVTFGECFSNLGHLIDLMEIKGKYIGFVVKSLLFGLLGGFGLLGKFGAGSNK